MNAAVQGFLPSTSAFHFPNSWPHVAAFTIDVAGLQVPLGDASRGLCGGMAFAARDYFEAHRPIPVDMFVPSDGPLYEFIGQRLKDSFDLPLGPTKYLDLMSAPDGDVGIPGLGWLFTTWRRGIAWRTITEEVPKIVADIDAGQLSCIGLVCTRGVNPMELGRNHQVLAYRYEHNGDLLRVGVYDPNRPNRDDVTLDLSLIHPTHPTQIMFVNGSKEVRGFFRVKYSPVTPPTP
jgi:hypothetical protein